VLLWASVKLLSPGTNSEPARWFYPKFLGLSQISSGLQGGEQSRDWYLEETFLPCTALGALLGGASKPEPGLTSPARATASGEGFTPTGDFVNGGM